MHVQVCITEIMLAKHISVFGYLTHLMQQSLENLLIMNGTDNHPHHLCDISELGKCCTGYKSIYRYCTQLSISSNLKRMVTKAMETRDTKSQHQNTNLADARRTLRVLSPIFKPLSAAIATSVTAGSCKENNLTNLKQEHKDCTCDIHSQEWILSRDVAL
jgi:hypothetical protein